MWVCPHRNLQYIVAYVFMPRCYSSVWVPFVIIHFVDLSTWIFLLSDLPLAANTHTYLLTYLLHGAESFLRSQPVNFAASQEIPRIYGTRKFLTVPTSDRHPSLSWANSIQQPIHILSKIASVSLWVTSALWQASQQFLQTCTAQLNKITHCAYRSLYWYYWLALSSVKALKHTFFPQIFRHKSVSCLLFPHL